MKFEKLPLAGSFLVGGLSLNPVHAEESGHSTPGPDPQQTTAAGTPLYGAFANGLVLSDRTGTWKLTLNGRLQADYRQFFPDAAAADTFSVRRVRFGATLLRKKFTLRVEGEYAGSGVAMTYGYVEFSGSKMAKIRIGQFKPLYGLERAQSTNFTDFQERSLADALLGGTFDRGVMVYATPLPGISYSVAYINGNGTADKDNAREDGKDATARLSANLAEFAGWSDSVVHVGGFAAAGREASRNKAGFIPVGQSEAQGLRFFATTCAPTACGAAASLANAFMENVDRRREGIEMALAHGPLKLQGELIRVAFAGTGIRRDMTAWYADAMWNLTGERFAAMYRDGVFGRLQPNRDFGAGKGEWGAFQLGLRYSKFRATDFANSNAAGSGVLLNNPSGATDGVLVATNEADAWTLGVNWILDPNMRLVANWVHTEFATPVTVRANGSNSTLGHENALTLRCQFDF